MLSVSPRGRKEFVSKGVTGNNMAANFSFIASEAAAYLYKSVYALYIKILAQECTEGLLDSGNGF